MFLQNFIWADYFGRESVGSIRGLVNPINLVVGGLGPPAAGYVHDTRGHIRSGVVGRRWRSWLCLRLLTLATHGP